MVTQLLPSEHRVTLRRRDMIQASRYLYACIAEEFVLWNNRIIKNRKDKSEVWKVKKQKLV